jgi:predicted DsbA family dithiol-disulfide isomerase
MIDSQRLRFYFDYTDPASYLLDLSLREVTAESNIVVDRIAFEENPPPLPLFDPGDAARKMIRESLQPEADRIGVKLIEPWIVPWTRKAHELAAYAESKNCFREIHESLFRAYLSGGQDIGRVDVLVTIARERGLDSMETKAALDVDQFSQAIAEQRHNAVVEGVNGVPTLLLGEMRLEGFVDRETLKEFLATGPEPKT